MSLATPTTSQLSTLITGQIETKLSQSIPILPKAVFRVLGWVIAGVAIILYKYAGFIFLQMFVRYATIDEVEVNGEKFRPLVEWGRLIGEGDPDEGTQAQLQASLAVIIQSGSLTAGRLFTGSNGVTYSLVSDVALNAASVQIVVKAVDDPDGNEGFGEVGNLDNGAKLSLAVPLSNVAREATVTGTAIVGAEPELEDAYRTRVINRFQRRPQGGAYADYYDWGTDADGVVSVYPYSSSTPGFIDVYVESSTAPDGLASPTHISAVTTAINFDPENNAATRRPANAVVNVYSITRTGFDLEVANLTAPDLADTKAAIEDAADEWFRSRAPYIEGLSALPRKDRLTQPEIAGIIASIVNAKGGSYTGLVVKRSGIVVAAYTLAAGELAKRGTVSYT